MSYVAMNLGHLYACCVMLSAMSSHAQTWTYIFDPSSEVHVVNDAIDHFESTVLLGTNVHPPISPGIWLTYPINADGTSIHRITNGQLVSSVVLGSDHGINRYLMTLLPSNENKLVGVGSAQIDYPLDTLRWMGLVSIIDPSSGVEFDVLAPPEREWKTSYGACRSTELGYIGFANGHFGFDSTIGPTSLFPTEFDVFKVPNTIDGVSFCTAYNGIGAFTATHVHPWPTGGLLTTSYSLWQPNALNAGSIVTLENDLCTVRFGFPTLAPSPESDRYSDAIGFSPQSLPTRSNTVIVTGQSNDIFYDVDIGIQSRTVVQVYDTTGNLLRERKFRSTYWADSNPVLNSMDTTALGRFYFAQMEGMDVRNYTMGIPSSVRVMLIDTLLQIHGQYIIDGFIENRLYEIRRVRSAADGGVFLMGRVKDLGIPQAPWLGWITKVSPMDLITSAPERGPEISLHLYPNPGSEKLVLEVPQMYGTILIHDATGRSVFEKASTGGRITLNTGDLRPGVYHISWMDVQGRFQKSSTWLKQ